MDAPKETEKEPTGKPSVWEKTTAQHVLRYVPKGTYYLRVKIRGRVVRESLKTDKFAVAKWNAVDRLRVLRAVVGGKSSENCPATLVEALAIVRAQVDGDPSLKSQTRRSYLERLDDMKPGEPAGVPVTPLPRLSARDVAEWWKKAAAAYAPQRANHLLMFMRRAIAGARKAGALMADPTQELKRVKIPRTRLVLPTAEEFFAVVKSIREVRTRNHASADYIEFMAYSGMRPAELAALEWEQIKPREIQVFGGEEGTKGGEFRVVPIIPPLADLLARMRADGLERIGKVFPSGATWALTAACRRLGIAHQRLYNMRHLFATTCIESGVDVPTTALWLGHKDGGALAMRTYVQNRSEHSDRMAAKVSFKAG